MAIAEALSRICPQPSGGTDLSECDLTLLAGNGDGLGVPCHEVLLRARCSSLPQVVDGTIQVPYSEAVIYAFMRWIYCEKLDRIVEIDHSTGLCGIGSSLLELALNWGLHDVTCLRERLTASWRTCKRPGSLAEDLLRAYNARQLGGRFQFICVSEDGAEAAPVYGGWPLVLRNCSSYFCAMFGGAWAESKSSQPGSEIVEVRVCWQREQLARLLRFLHGACFVSGPGDLQAAALCSDFFGVPSLVAHANDWVAANLRVTNASSFWCFLETEPRLWLRNGDRPGFGDICSDCQEACADADQACFDFHIKHFDILAGGLEEEEMRVPLHELSKALMGRLMASGLVSMPKEALTEVVEKYALAKCGGKDKEYTELCNSLRPPAVLFNRAHRDMLTGGVAASIQAVL